MKTNKNNLRPVSRVLAGIGITFIFLYVVVGAHGKNILSNSVNPYVKQINNSIFMEGFGFFTKSPKNDETYELYSISNGISSRLNLRNNSSYNSYGLSRRNRVRLLEIGHAVQSIGNKNWISSKSDDFEKYILGNLDTLAYRDVELDLKGLERGKYIIAKSKPIPWEWNKIKTTNDLKYVAINIL